jgi:hypothetical protein
VVIEPQALKTEEDSKIRLQISHLIPKANRQAWLTMNKNMPLLTDGKNTSLFIVTAVVEEHKRSIAAENKEEYDKLMKEITTIGTTKEAMDKAIILAEHRRRDEERERSKEKRRHRD